MDRLETKADEIAKQYWLLAPGQNAKYWDEFYEGGIAAIGWDHLGDLNQYESREQLEQQGLGKHDSLACWEFCHEMNEGDEIFVKRGRAHIIGHGIIRSGYRFEEKRSYFKNVRDVEWLEKVRGVRPREKLLVTKTLTNITKYPQQVQSIERVFSDSPTTSSIPPYTIQEIERDIFLSRTEIEQLIDLLKRKKNLVLQGSPGTGKTYLARRLAWLLAGEKSEDRIETVQFHQSYSYEDFVRGYRPNKDGGFELEDGTFLRFCERAMESPDHPFVLLVDEINRGNLSRIFGELLMLIEVDKRSDEWAVRMAYTREGEDQFHVPPNLYLIGAMNTADRSLALVDYALRRRFVFRTVEPAFGNGRFDLHLEKRGVPEELTRMICEHLGALNEAIGQDPRLGEGFRIGHSYFCDPPENLRGTNELSGWKKWYQDVIRYEIEPLLYEYWFDAPERAQKEVEKLLARSSEETS